MRLTPLQVAILVVVVVGLGYVVVSQADGWADWVVLGVVFLTALGFAIAVRPKIYERRKRSISRESPPPRP